MDILGWGVLAVGVAILACRAAIDIAFWFVRNDDPDRDRNEHHEPPRDGRPDPGPR